MKKIFLSVITVFALLFYLLLELSPASVFQKIQVFHFYGVELVAHFCMSLFLTLIILLGASTFFKGKRFAAREVIITGICLIIFCVLGEILQSILDIGRSAAWDDIVISILAIVLSCDIWISIFKENRNI